MLAPNVCFSSKLCQAGSSDCSGVVPIRCSFSPKRFASSSPHSAVIPRAPPVSTHVLPGRILACSSYAPENPEIAIPRQTSSGSWRTVRMPRWPAVCSWTASRRRGECRRGLATWRVLLNNVLLPARTARAGPDFALPKAVPSL